MQGIPVTKKGNSPLGTIIANLPKPEVKTTSGSEAHKYIIKTHPLTPQKINELLLLWLLRNKLQQDSRRDRSDMHHQTVQIISEGQQYRMEGIPYVYKEEGTRTFNPVYLNRISNAISLAPAGLTIAPQNDELDNLAKLIKPAKGHNPLIDPSQTAEQHGNITMHTRRITAEGVVIDKKTTGGQGGITYIIRNPFDPERIQQRLETLQAILLAAPENPQPLTRYRLVKSLLDLLIVKITLHDYHFTEAAHNDIAKQTNVEIPQEFQRIANQKIEEITSAVGADRIVFGILWATQARTAQQAAQELQQFVTQIKLHFPVPEYNEEHEIRLRKLTKRQQYTTQLYRIYPLLE